MFILSEGIVNSLWEFIQETVAVATTAQVIDIDTALLKAKNAPGRGALQTEEQSRLFQDQDKAEFYKKKTTEMEPELWCTPEWRGTKDQDNGGNDYYVHMKAEKT